MPAMHLNVGSLHVCEVLLVDEDLSKAPVEFDCTKRLQ